MRQITIRSNEAGQRLDKFLQKYMKEAPASFFYKMMRKKNILLNGKKCAGSEKLVQGDCIRLYLAQETLEKFGAPAAGKTDLSPYEKAYKAVGPLPVLWENEHALAVDKPVGLLSQKARPGDLSLNEWLIGYLLQKGDVFAEELSTFRPSVCNRLDRNTSGIVLCSKSLLGSQELTEAIREKSARKFYRMLAGGRLEKGGVFEGWERKDTSLNQVRILKTPQKGAQRIRTRIRPLVTGNLPGVGPVTYAEAELFTGKTHQIRASLAAMGHPLLGDAKYGRIRTEVLEGYGVLGQMLHACRVEFDGSLHPDRAGLCGLTLTAPLPQPFERILAALKDKKDIEVN